MNLHARIPIRNTILYGVTLHVLDEHFFFFYSSANIEKYRNIFYTNKSTIYVIEFTIQFLKAENK